MVNLYFNPESSRNNILFATIRFGKDARKYEAIIYRDKDYTVIPKEFSQTGEIALEKPIGELENKQIYKEGEWITTPLRSCFTSFYIQDEKQELFFPKVLVYLADEENIPLMIGFKNDRLNNIQLTVNKDAGKAYLAKI